MKRPILFSKESTNIFFHILTQCNLKCRHCYINREEHGHISLDIGTIISWLELFSKDSKKSNVVFLGGEPTIHPHLSTAVKKAIELGYNSIVIDTNGYRVSNLLDKLQPNDLDSLSFSLDGPTARINDIIRGNGSYNCCLKGIQDAKNKGFKTSVIYTVSMANFHYLNQMPKLLSSIGVDHFFIQVIGVRGKWTQNRETRTLLGQVNYRAWLESIPSIAQQITNYGISVTYPKVFLKPDDIFECAGLVGNNYFIFPNGRVYRCPLCEDYPLHSNEIKNGDLIDTKVINETSLFNLNIPEGCVMNKIIQPDNIRYDSNGFIKYRIACCMLKEELKP